MLEVSLLKLCLAIVLTYIATKVATALIQRSIWAVNSA